MPGSTPGYGLPYSLGTDAGSTIDNTMQSLAEGIEALLAPVIVTADGSGAPVLTLGAEADVPGSVLNITPSFVSTVVVRGYIFVSCASGGSGRLRVRQDSTNDSFESEMAIGAITGGANHMLTVEAVFTGVTAAAHTYRLRAGGGGEILRFRIIAMVIPEGA